MSYAHQDNQDSATADHVELLLQRKGKGVLRDETEIHPGQELTPRIKSMIGDCDTFVAVFSPKWSESTWCQAEWQYACKLRSGGDAHPRVVLIECGRGMESPFLAADILRVPGDTRSERERSVSRMVEGETRWRGR